MTKIKFIYFDIGNVLLLFSGGLEKLAKKYGKTHQDFERIFRKYDYLVCIGKLSPQELWGKYYKELGLKEGQFDFLEYWLSNCTLISESFVLISELAKTKLSIGLLSNLYAGAYESLEKDKFFPYKD